jgi:excisionase family DNA binding protein
MFKIKQAALMLGVSETTLRRMIRVNSISFRKVGSIFRFTQDDIDVFIEHSKVMAKEIIPAQISVSDDTPLFASIAINDLQEKMK